MSLSRTVDVYLLCKAILVSFYYCIGYHINKKIQRRNTSQKFPRSGRILKCEFLLHKNVAEVTVVAIKRNFCNEFITFRNFRFQGCSVSSYLSHARRGYLGPKSQTHLMLRNEFLIFSPLLFSCRFYCFCALLFGILMEKKYQRHTFKLQRRKSAYRPSIRKSRPM